MTQPISFCCPSCHVRLKAPAQLQGMARNCPGCGRRVTVPSPRLQDAGPVLVFEDRRVSLNAK